MSSRHAPGVFFAGELLDVDGVTGGHNFQSCWTTGCVAGRAAGAYARRHSSDAHSQEKSAPVERVEAGDASS
jgi:hypothetical protein